MDSDKGILRGRREQTDMTDEQKRLVVANIKALARRRGIYTSDHLAAQSGTMPATMEKWMEAKRVIPILGLYKIAKALETTIDFLLQGIDDPEELEKYKTGK